MHRYLVAAALALGFHTAFASETFELSVIGSGLHWYVNGAPGCEGVPTCGEGGVDETWLGDLSLQTTSAADGTYATGAGLLALTYSSNFDGFTYADGDQQHLVYPQFSDGVPYLAGLVPGASVTIAGGRVVDVEGSFVWDGSGSLDFHGLSVADYDGGQVGQPNSDFWKLTGALAAGSAPATSPAPEPSEAALLLAALAGLAVTRIARCGGRCWPARSGTR